MTDPLKLAWAALRDGISWVHCEFRESAENFMRDLRSMSALWNWLFMILYAGIIIYLVRFHGTTCGNTAIMTTGGIVTAIFTNYIWGEFMKKKHGLYANYDIHNRGTNGKPNLKTDIDDSSESD